MNTNTPSSVPPSTTSSSSTIATTNATTNINTATNKTKATAKAAVAAEATGTTSIIAPQPFSEVGRCLLSATISNAGEAGNTAVISHFKPLIRSNAKEIQGVAEQKRLVQEIREEFELFFQLANTSLLKAKLLQQRKQNLKLIQKLKTNRKKVHQNLLNTIYDVKQDNIKNGAKEINNIGNSKIKTNTKDGTLSSSQKEFLSAISDVGIHAIKSNLKHVLMQNTINNKRKNKNVNNNIVKLNMNDNIDVNNNNSLVDDSDTESIASTTSTMTTMTDDTSISNDSGTTVSGFSSKNINSSNISSSGKRLLSNKRQIRSVHHNLTMHETLLLRMRQCTIKE